MNKSVFVVFINRGEGFNVERAFSTRQGAVAYMKGMEHFMDGTFDEYFDEIVDENGKVIVGITEYNIYE